MQIYNSYKNLKPNIKVNIICSFLEKIKLKMKVK